MNRIIIPTVKGDETLVEWEVGDVEAEEKARGAFDKARSEGFGAISAKDGGVAVGEFSPKVEEILLIQPIAGG